MWKSTSELGITSTPSSRCSCGDDVASRWAGNLISTQAPLPEASSEGICVDEKGEQQQPRRVARVQALRVERDQVPGEVRVYGRTSLFAPVVLPCEGRISGIVDVPNAVATLAVPLAIFVDVRPSGGALSNAVWSPENHAID